MDGVIAVIGTLLGALLGASGAFLAQRTADRARERQRLADLRREAYVGFLAAVHRMFVQVSRIYRDHPSDPGVVQQLAGVSPEAAQLCFEQVRLLASNDVAECASGLWSAMRRHSVPLGHDLSSDARRAWRNDYWTMRGDFTQAAREEMGLAALDWTRVGVTGVARQ